MKPLSKALPITAAVALGLLASRTVDFADEAIRLTRAQCAEVCALPSAPQHAGAPHDAGHGTTVADPPAASPPASSALDPAFAAP